MKRLIKFECGTIDDLNIKKYVLTQEYESFGIYEEVCPIMDITFIKVGLLQMIRMP